MTKIKSVNTLPDTPREFGFWLDGKSVAGGKREMNIRHSPAHDVAVTHTPICTSEDVDTGVASARAAFDDRRWSGLGGDERATILLKTAELIRKRMDEIIYWEVLESGKPIAQVRGEVGGCIGMFEYASGLARSLHGDSFNNLGDGMFGLVTREPIGVVGLITPWNFPFLILCERVPYILASGCSIVAKPSEFTSATTLILAEILTEAGLPDSVMNVVTGPGPTVGQALAEHQDVDMLSFTGSTRVGRLIVEASGKSNFKKLGLEMGGKNPQVVFADADLEDAADGVVFGFCFNTGQCCVSGSRLLVERSVADELTQLIKGKIAKVRVGDPLDEQTQIGAITTDAQRKTILSYIKKGIEEGAEMICGDGELDLGMGSYIGPVAFSGVNPDMSIFRDEIFGPVLTISTFDTLEEAIRMANDTDYGLAASVWSKNIDTALQATRRIRAGRFWVNTTLSGGPELPIGGFKQSGWGRETGIYGVEEYTQIKSVHVEIGKRNHWIE